MNRIWAWRSADVSQRVVDIMISCAKCGKPNTIDGSFCHGCGAELSPEELQSARESLDELMGEGRKLLTEHRAAEAQLVAEAALAQAPNSTAALSLLGECHEHFGRHAEALQCMDKALEIDPNSALDRIKATYLRRLLSEETTGKRSKSRSAQAAIAAIAGMVLVGSIGAIVILNRKSATEAAGDVGGPLVATKQDQAQPFATGFQDLSQSRQSGTPLGDPIGTNPNTNKLQANQDQTQVAATKPLTPRAAPPTGSGQTGPLPGVGNRSAVSNQVGPIEIRPSTSDLNMPPATTRTSNATDVDPSPDTKKPEDRPGIVDIRPSSDNPQQVGGSETVQESNPNEVGTLIRVARNHFLTGNYAKAAAAYQKALSVGADPASTNQRLAQCLEKLGQRGAAAAAYENAAQAYASQLASGKGDKARLRSGLEACQQAAKLLKGG